MTTVLTTAASLAGVIVGALLHYVLTTRSKHDEELRERRHQAYADFINASSRVMSARRIGHVKDELDELASLNDAKARICLFGETTVVRELIKFWQHGATLEREQEVLAFTRLCLRMRESAGHKGTGLGSIDISQLLFKLEPSNYSYRNGNSKT
jgi:hypothetical protein